MDEETNKQQPESGSDSGRSEQSSPRPAANSGSNRQRPQRRRPRRINPPLPSEVPSLPSEAANVTPLDTSEKINSASEDLAAAKPAEATPREEREFSGRADLRQRPEWKPREDRERGRRSRSNEHRRENEGRDREGNWRAREAGAPERATPAREEREDAEQQRLRHERRERKHRDERNHVVPTKTPTLCDKIIAKIKSLLGIEEPVAIKERPTQWKRHDGPSGDDSRFESGRTSRGGGRGRGNYIGKSRGDARPGERGRYRRRRDDSNNDTGGRNTRRENPRSTHEDWNPGAS